MRARTPLRALAILLLCAGCRVWGPVRDLQQMYNREEALAQFAIPRRAGDSPVEAANAPEVMQETVRHARGILAGAGRPPARASKVRERLTSTVTTLDRP